MFVSMDKMTELEKIIQKKSKSQAQAATIRWKRENKDKIREYNRQYYLKRKAAKLSVKEGAEHGNK